MQKLGLTNFESQAAFAKLLKPYECIPTCLTCNNLLSVNSEFKGSADRSKQPLKIVKSCSQMCGK